MSVRRDKRGRWTVDIQHRNADGTERRVTRTSAKWTKRDAESWERDARYRLANGTFDPVEREVKPETPTFETFVNERWLPTYPAAAGNRPKTVIERRWALSHVLPELGQLRVDAIGGERIERLSAALRGKGLSDKSIKCILSTLHRVLTSAVEWGVIEGMPRFPKVKVADRGFDHYAADESRRIIDAARTPDDRAAIMFALQTGLRVGEQRAVEWGDLDLQRGEVSVRRNRPIGLRETGATKSGKVRRVPLTAELVAALKRCRHLRGPLVFCRPDGRHFEDKDFGRALRMACARAGVRKLRWHDLRHSFASQAVEAGVPLNVVQQWLGHSTITMTMRYAHLAPDSGARWIRAFERASADIAQTRAGAEAN